MNLKGGSSWSPPSVRSSGVAPSSRAEAEPARVAPFEPLRPPLAFRGVPDDLGQREALADGVEDVEQLVLQLVAVQPVAHHVGLRRFVDVVVVGDSDVELRHRALPRAEHAGIVVVALLDRLGELEIAQRLALVGLAQDRGEAMTD